MKCKHLSISAEAYRGGEAAAVFICGWPAAKLGRLRPAWVDRSIGGGLMIDHKTECPLCPCFERQEASNG